MRVPVPAGYIGSHTIRQLLAGERVVTALDNLRYGYRWAVQAARLVVANLCNADLGTTCSSAAALRKSSTSLPSPMWASR